MSTSAQTDALPPGEPGPRDDGPTGTGASPGAAQVQPGQVVRFRG